jgi:hypothetical protein
MLDAGALVKKHRARGVFVDTNLLVLLLVGLVNIRRIGTFKRTQDFTIDDFHLLRQLLGWFGTPIFSTPHVLSQVSDLTDLSGRELIAIRRLFKFMIATIEEQYDAARKLVDDPMFERFGLGDASIAAVCRRKVLILTADLQLQIALESLGLDAINFNHLRALNWFASDASGRV